MLQILVLWESPEEEGNWGYGAGGARPIPPISFHPSRQLPESSISVIVPILVKPIADKGFLPLYAEFRAVFGEETEEI